MRFRKKPIVIEAHQWMQNGDHPRDYCRPIYDPEDKIWWSANVRKERRWEGDVVRYYRSPDGDMNVACSHCNKIMLKHGWIDTLEEGHIVCPGDWIITGVNGEHYPCKPDIFAATYEKV